jgi:hypothetical protein
MLRELVWIDHPKVSWLGMLAMRVDFQPYGPPSGHTVEEMKQNFEDLRDKEFVSHVCAKCPRKPMPDTRQPPE